MSLTTVDNVIAIYLCSSEESAVEISARIQLIEAIEERFFRKREDFLEVFRHLALRSIVSGRIIVSFITLLTLAFT